MAKAEIRNRVRKLRSEHGGMTQQELADHCDCTRQTIIALEHINELEPLAVESK